MNFIALPAPSPCLLWQVDLDRDPAPEGLAMLSDDEWLRARRFAFERDRRRYLAAHAALRQLLSQHTDVPGALLTFAHGKFGKPSLEGQAGSMRFNLTHSGPVALIAFHPLAEIGVDVEQIRPLPDAIMLAEAHFSQEERESLARLHDEERDRGFLRCWTRKEACIKAAGLGLGELDTRTIHVGIDQATRIVTVTGESGSQQVALASFDIGPQTLGAIATLQVQQGMCGDSRKASITEMCA